MLLRLTIASPPVSDAIVRIRSLTSSAARVTSGSLSATSPLGLIGVSATLAVRASASSLLNRSEDQGSSEARRRSSHREFSIIFPGSGKLPRPEGGGTIWLGERTLVGVDDVVVNWGTSAGSSIVWLTK